MKRSQKCKVILSRALMAVMFIASTSTVAAKDTLDFKGFPIGGRIEAFKQKFPSFQCKPTGYQQFACESFRETYAGLDLDSILVSFADGRLHGFQVDGTGADKKSKILAAMKEKYGEPRSEKDQTTHWDLSNGSCRLLSVPPPRFQMICMSNASLPKSDKLESRDI